ncbi:MAG TPA: HEAT repeat domain-containing protein, partial [Mycobacterium sp.]|nr:HEAT repeat domain-containing protein [Mycobacterium sp.]
MLDAADEADGFADFPDVREHLTELLARGEPSLEDVDWGRFRHAYGPADDVPGLLRGLYDKDAKRASDSLSTLWNSVRHQGGSSAPAALAVPFLLRAVSDPAVHNRPELLLLAAEAGHRNHFGDDRRDNLLRVENPPDELWIDVSGYPVRWTLQAARRAIAASASQLIGLLDDPDPVLRIHAAYALATAASPPPAVRRALGARLDVEQDASVRVGLVLAVTQLTIEQGGDPDLVTWTERLWTGQDNPADLRLAGALAWLCATSAPPSQPLLDLLQAQAGATATGWLSRVPWPDDIDHRGGLVAWLVSFLGDALDTQVQVIRTAIAHRERTVAVSACRAAYDVARTWRTRTDDMRDLLAGVLDHPDHDVRVVAADLLALTGAVSTPVADRVAAALGDQDPTLRALATSTLAHRGDARAVAPLADLLTLG